MAERVILQLNCQKFHSNKNATTIAMWPLSGLLSGQEFPSCLWCWAAKISQIALEGKLLCCRINTGDDKFKVWFTDQLS